ncbi:MAG: 1-(5-phosphoribosyl)-5-[(5-phosphoribosylamino)methylideneamino]imidazole-4-carboxamide isomerase [Candidatus Jacksonbacteria bacterium RIFCSPLOWO2_12_FULL_44_15b]|nr:MAG: 1-(5-phosphoribosyl)-5-[(5-phosphoribosylamino)methylideneamino]imidazole-4-carboxamide isomerase [Candidatus Jacksonbacteria bacterium RIFCSPLOWO2_12_FULL_44_15b]
MTIIPAIDLLRGQAVRLKQGDYNQKTVYSDDPVSVAKKFVSQGARFLHVVDLDGARTGKMKNLTLILEMRKCAPVPMQVGGGIRSIESVEYLLKSGIDRVVLGTRVLEDTIFLQNAIKQFSYEKIAVSLDVKNGTPMVNGWREKGLKSVESLLQFFKDAGVSYLIYTDIVRDGMQTGPNFQAIKKIIPFGFQLIASGGVSRLADVERLEEMGLYGCIVGRAMYEDKNFLNNANQTNYPVS